MGKQEFDVIVVGAGASGSLTVANLLRKGFNGRLALVSQEEALGKGVAYRSRDDYHLLNVRAGKMSAFPDHTGHFVDWLRQRDEHLQNELASQELSGLSNSFQPRKVYGEYLSDVLSNAVLGSSAYVVVEQEAAIGLARSPHGLTLSLASGKKLVGRHIVLALGNLPPKAPREFEAVEGHRRWIGNPWFEDQIGEIKADETVLIVGTGLTMVDVVLTLKSKGHRGPIIARSRRGLVPTSHRLTHLTTTEPPKSLADLVDGCRAAGDEWRTAFDSARPVTQEIWQSLDWSERERLLRRLGVFWDVHRHRMPESVANLIDNLQSAGLLRVAGDRVQGLMPGADRITVRYQNDMVAANWVVNCTGPNSDWRGAKLALLESGRTEHLLDYDPLGLGLHVDNDGRLGNSGRLWSLGPPCRGCRLETTAIPEIRVQAKVLAGRILDALRETQTA